MFYDRTDYENYVKDSELITLFLNWRDIKLFNKNYIVGPVIWTYGEYVKEYNVKYFKKYKYYKYLKNYKKDNTIEVSLLDHFTKLKLETIDKLTTKYLSISTSNDILKLLEVLDEFVDLRLLCKRCGLNIFIPSSFDSIDQDNNIKTVTIHKYDDFTVTINMELTDIPTSSKSNNSILNSISSNNSMLLYTITYIVDKYSHQYTFISDENFIIYDYELEDQIILFNIIDFLSSVLLDSIKWITYYYAFAPVPFEILVNQYKILGKLDKLNEYEALSKVLNGDKFYVLQPDK